MRKNIYLITGTSSGIGYELTNQLIQNHKVIGITKKKNIKDKNFFFVKKDFAKLNNKKFYKKVISKISNRKTIFIINAAVNKKDTNQNTNYKNLIKVIYINFFNQIDLMLKLISLNKIKQIIVICSYNVFIKGKLNKGYTISKELLFEFAKIFQNNTNINFKSVILGSVNTKMFKKNKYFTHTKKKNLILQDPKIIAETIIKFISNKDKNVIFLPDKYKFITYFLYFWKFLKYVK